MALVVLDHFGMIPQLRQGLAVAATPFYWLADAPRRFSEWGSESLSSNEVLRSENAQLKSEQLEFHARLLKLDALEAENERLRELLNSSSLVDERVRVAELIGLSPDPARQIVILNRGSNDGVYVGQPVLDAYGLLGQVLEVTPVSSRVLLITDGLHAVPVQVNRNGLRAVAEGNGKPHALDVRYVSASADIRKGDLLVTSGLGGRFPAGYPVAVVESVAFDSGATFAEVVARPSAQLARSRYVLLVFSEAPPAPPPVATPAPPAPACPPPAAEQAKAAPAKAAEPKPRRAAQSHKDQEAR